MTYTNNHGQETLDVRIPHEVIERIVRRERRPWDWILFEYSVPLTGSAQQIGMRATRVIPMPLSNPPGRDEWSYDPGGAPNNDDGLTPPVIAYPNSSVEPPYSVTLSSNAQVSTLGVDLRRFNGGSVAVDLDGFVGVSSGDVLAGWTAGDSTTLSENTTTIGTVKLHVDGYTSSEIYWEPDIASIKAMYPYQGSAMNFTDTNWGATMSVAVEDAPTNNAAMSAAPQLAGHRPTFGSLSPDTQSANFTCQVDHFYNVQTHAPSGFVTGWERMTFDVNFTHTTGTFPGEEIHFDVDLIVATGERIVVPYYSSEPIPATMLGTMRYVGGFGEPPWTALQVFADIHFDDYIRWGFRTEGDPIIPGTTFLADNIPIHGPNEHLYAPVGRVIVDPLSYSAGFELP